MDRTYDPELYDLVNAGSFQGDIEWYRQKARVCGGRVLELGVGTGRVMLPIAQDGVSIHGIDADPGMLAELRRKIASLPADVQKRITLAEGDMRSFRAEGTFALVIIPFRAFLHSVTASDQVACLRSVHDHLEPGGTVAFNVFHPSLDYMAQHVGAFAGVWRWRGTHALSDGRVIVRSEANRYDTVHQRVRSQQRYEEYAADGNLVRTFLQRLELAYLYPADIRRLLEQTGFGQVHITGGFNGQPFASDTDELVVEATRL
jgi:SAM-dependent methyltransferase